MTPSRFTGSACRLRPLLQTYFGGCELSLLFFLPAAGPDPVVCGADVCGGVVCGVAAG